MHNFTNESLEWSAWNRQTRRILQTDNFFGCSESSLWKWIFSYAILCEKKQMMHAHKCNCFPSWKPINFHWTHNLRLTQQFFLKSHLPTNLSHLMRTINAGWDWVHCLMRKWNWSVLHRSHLRHVLQIHCRSHRSIVALHVLMNHSNSNCLHLYPYLHLIHTWYWHFYLSWTFCCRPKIWCLTNEIRDRKLLGNQFKKSIRTDQQPPSILQDSHSCGLYIEADRCK